MRFNLVGDPQGLVFGLGRFVQGDFFALSRVGPEPFSMRSVLLATTALAASRIFFVERFSRRPHPLMRRSRSLRSRIVCSLPNMAAGSV